VFLTKKFKEKYQHYVLETFLNAMIKNIKIYNILDIIELLKCPDLINLFQKNYENVFLSVSYDFSKFDGSKKLKV